MGEVYLTWRDICEAYDGEWVLIVRPPPNERTEVLGGWVLARSTQREDLELAWELLPQYQELVITEVSLARAKELEDDIANWDYLLWRWSFVWGEIEWLEEPPPPTPPRSVKRWWQFWR